MCDGAPETIEMGLKEGFKVEKGKFPSLNSANRPYVVLVSPQGKRYPFYDREVAKEAFHLDTNHFAEEVEGK